MGLLWNVEPPGRAGGYRGVLLQHLPLVFIAGLILLAAALLPLDRIPYTICTFLRLTGYPCPSCGLTRGFVAMAQGQWLAVLHTCPLAVLLYAATALVFAVNMAALLCGVRLTPGRWLRWRARAWVVFLCFFGLLILFNWLYRLALGLK
ncbi:MAG: DUF2752 domain-containing protein [Kiritimatiellaeota bacterium]|nr:DUF2752 domain-containing protein [Kiritimatiellota bacterium]